MTSNNHISVSIIVPAYNYGHLIAECLDSIIAQTHSNWECIIIDNGSTDNTADVVKGYVAKDKRFHYYYTEQKGVSYARNLAVSYSKSDFILPVDADDKIAGTYLEKALKVIVEHNEFKVVYCDAQLFGASSGKWILPEYSLKDLLKENSIFCTALFRKSDFMAVNGYNENMVEGFEDWDFWIRMLKDGSKVYKIPETLFYYRIKAMSRNSQLDDEKQLMLRLRIAENHSDLYQKIFSTPELIYQNYKLERELKSLRGSANEKIGKLILSPFRFIKNIIKS